MSDADHAHADFEGMDIRNDISLAEFVEMNSTEELARRLGIVGTDDELDGHDFRLAQIEVTYVDRETGIRSAHSVAADDYDPSVFDDDVDESI